MDTQEANCTVQDFNASIDDLLNNNNNITATTTTSSESNDNAQSTLVFRAFVIFIGVVGAAFNGLVLKVIASKKLKSQKKFTPLFVNQVVIDFASCVAVIVNYSVKIPVLYLRDGWGFFVCCLFYTEASVFYFQQGSICNLVLIAVERCLLIVHQIAYKKYVRNWMTYAGIFFAWFVSFPYTLQTPFTTRVIDGQCLGQYFWPSKHGQTIYSIFVILSMFVVPLLLMIVCYSRILFFVRRHQKVMQGNATHGGGPRSIQSQAQRQEMGTLVTMLLISTAFVACWTPNQVYFLLYIMQVQMSNKDAIYNVSLFLIFLNVCLNPFIYVAKQESIRKGVIEHLSIIKLKSKPQPNTVSVTDTTVTN